MEDGKNWQDVRFDDAFAEYRDRPPVEAPVVQEPWTPAEQVGKRPLPVMGLLAVIVSCLPFAPSVAGLIFGIITARSGNRMDYGPNRLLGLIAAGIAGVRLIFTIAVLLFVFWALTQATI